MSATGSTPLDAPAEPRLGEPVELPWWAPAALLPPLLGLAGGLLLGAPPEARITVLVASALLAWVVVKVATGVRSANMQSVWISAAYAFWAFPVLIWAVTAWPPHLFR